MTPEIYPIPLETKGRLFIMPKPSGETLRDDIAHYRSMGADHVISMIEQVEIDALSLQDEGRLCESMQMRFTQFPITDFGLPEPDAFKILVRDIAQRLRGGEGIAVHCRAGIGRSGMVACCVVATIVGDGETAIDIVTKARGMDVPDTPEQRAFIVEMANT